jgi:hypothetical protein
MTALEAAFRLGPDASDEAIGEAQRAAGAFVERWVEAWFEGRHGSGTIAEGRGVVVESARTATLLARAFSLPPASDEAKSAMQRGLARLREALDRGLRVEAFSPAAPEANCYVDVTERFARVLATASVEPLPLDPLVFEEPGAWRPPGALPEAPRVAAPRATSTEGDRSFRADSAIAMAFAIAIAVAIAIAAWTIATRQ